MHLVPASSQNPALTQAQAALDQSNWTLALHLFAEVLEHTPRNAMLLRASIEHNLAVCNLGLGRHSEALRWAQMAKNDNPQLWQSVLVMGRVYRDLGQADRAQVCFLSILKDQPSEPEALLSLADLYINQFGNPMGAKQLVTPLLSSPQHFPEAALSWIMASLYDREESAEQVSAWVKSFSKKHIQILPACPARPLRSKVFKGKARPRVGLISPLFCASPVYFLTIHGFKHVAKGSDLIVFNRGYKNDWATEVFRSLSLDWHEVQALPAHALSQTLYEADLDVLYDLGGWMDAVALKALSTKPARQMYKWVGGQSVTTGLDVFDGWIGDPWQSPERLQSLYSEPLINIANGYATYTPPPYFPKVKKIGGSRLSDMVVFANPAKLSRAFLAQIRKKHRPVVFVHHQFRLPGVKQRVSDMLGDVNHQFMTPTSHQEALEVISQYSTLLDTFPYSGGLTVREAKALGLSIQGRVGELFCERHSAQWL